MKKIIFNCVVWLSLIVFFVSCSAEISDVIPLKATVCINNEFLITLSCPQYEFMKRDVENIHYSVNVEYVGEDESIEIRSSMSICAFSVKNSAGESVYNGVIPDLLRTGTLLRNEPNITDFTGEDFVDFLELDDGELLPDTYIVVAFGHFAASDNAQDYNFSLELPLIIK